MPFKSIAQARYLAHHPSKIGGLRNVQHWAAMTNYGNLPQHIGKVPAPKRQSFRTPRAGEKQ